MRKKDTHGERHTFMLIVPIPNLLRFELCPYLIQQLVKAGRRDHPTMRTIHPRHDKGRLFQRRYRCRKHSGFARCFRS